MSTSTLQTAPLGHVSSPADSVGRTLTGPSRTWLRRVGATAHLWAQRRRARHDLATALRIHLALGQAAAVRDLGGTPGELLWEAEKPFWRA